MTEHRKQKIRLVAIDVDDTLITPELTISQPVKEAVQAARRMGVTVTLATGRMYRSALPFARQLGLDLPLIVYQGALVKHSKTGETLWHRPVAKSVAGEVLDFLRQENLHINTYLDDHLYMEKMDDTSLGYMGLAKVPVSLIRNHKSLLEKGEPTKILAIGKPEHLASLVEPARERWGGDLFVTRSKPHYLEFMDQEAGKGAALAFLAEQLKIDPSEIMAIGDSYNDLDLLEYAGFGVAMGNAPDEVKARAQWVAPSNREDGVAVALGKWVLI